MKSEKMTVILINHKSDLFLKRALASLYEKSPQVQEVLVIENEGRALKDIQREFPHITLLRNSKPLGFAANVNRGIRSARGTLLMLLNPDTLLYNDVPSLLAHFLERHPEVGIAGPSIFNPDGTLQPSARTFPTFSAALARNTPLQKIPYLATSARRYLQADTSSETPRKVDWVSGCCMAFSKELALKLGLFDEKFQMYVEDIDFCLSAYRAGYLTCYVPQAKMCHFGHGSTSQQPYRNIFLHHKSMLRFAFKHRMLPKAFYPLLVGAAALRCLYAMGYHAYRGLHHRR